jgi:HEAT repeat protein
MHPRALLYLLVACTAGSVQLEAGESAKKTPPVGAQDVKVVCDRWPDGSSLRQFALDAIRLSGAKTQKQKALAIFRWMRRWTMFTNGHAPSERGRKVLDDLKILHVFGAHWCDGRALCMENLWRSIGGRAWKLYVPVGYTMALVHWRDDDGVERWHQMHCSRGWYVYDRAGKLVAHPDQIGADLSLMLRPSRTGVPRSGHPPRPWNWIAVSHRRFSTHDISLDLRLGETYDRAWGNEGLPACDNIAKEQYPDGEHGPYEITYGNGRLVSRLDPAAPGLLRKEGGRFVVDWPVRTPHLLADAWLEGKLPAGLVARFSPDGRNWFDLPGAAGGRLELGRKCRGRKNVVGRYRYVLRLSWPAGARPRSAEETPRLVNVVQHNMFSLPQLWPGRNRIRVSARLPVGTALKVAYTWDDAGGKGRRHVAVAEKSPFNYVIAASGRKWTDVRCRRLTISCVPADGKGNRIEVREPEAGFEDPPAPQTMDEIVGAHKPEALKKTAEYLEDLEAADEKRKIQALDALMVLRDPKAAKALTAMIYSAEDLPLHVRGRAMQALYRSLPAEEAFKVLLPVVRRDERVKWIAALKGRGWKSLSSLVAHLAADAGYRKALPDLLAGFKRGVGIWNRMTYLRAFGRFKAREAVPSCIGALRWHSDVSASAAWALGEIGDRSAIPHIVRAIEGRMARRPHQMILYAWGAEALGKLKARSPQALKLLAKLLAHEDEEVRGAAAKALGLVGSKAQVVALKAAAAKERFAWVRKRMLAAAEALSAGGAK